MTTRTEERSRITYWKNSMDHARRFMTRLMDYPVRESGEELVSIEEAVDAARVEVAFSTTPIVDDLPRIFEVREGLIGPLLAVALEMNERGWVLMIEDGFRTAEMQRRVARKTNVFDAILQKVIWEIGGTTPDLELMYRRLSVLSATVPKVAGHMSGCAVDISVLERDTRRPLDRGGPYLEMSELTPMYSPYVPAAALQQRAQITELMEKHEFVAYPFEFWHYSMGDVFAEHLRCSGAPARYAAVDRDPETGRIQPVADLTAPLHSEADIRQELAAALERMSQADSRMNEATE